MHVHVSVKHAPYDLIADADGFAAPATDGFIVQVAPTLFVAQSEFVSAEYHANDEAHQALVVNAPANSA